MSFEEIKAELYTILKEKRFLHTMGVVETAVALAKHYAVDEEKARYAALLHDCAKNLPDEELKRLCKKYKIKLDHVSKREPQLLHAYVGAEVAKRTYGITDGEILDAIFYHTTGKKDMSMLCKIIFIADMTEPGRSGIPNIDEIRKVMYEDLDKAIIMGFDSTISFVMKKGSLMHLDTLKARNYLIEERKDKEYGNS